MWTSLTDRYFASNSNSNSGFAICIWSIYRWYWKEIIGTLYTYIQQKTIYNFLNSNSSCDTRSPTSSYVLTIDQFNRDMTPTIQKFHFIRHVVPIITTRTHPTMTKTITTTKRTTTTTGSGTTTTTTTESKTTTTTTLSPCSKLPKLNWTRLNYDPDNHDNRRLLEHRAKNCECEVCYRELHKLPPAEPIRHKMAARHSKLKEREIKRAKKNAKKDVKAGKQACIRNFFRYWRLFFPSDIRWRMTLLALSQLVDCCF